MTDKKDHKFKVPPFRISFRYNNRLYSLPVVQLFVDDATEQFRIGTAKKSNIIETNRPYLRSQGFSERRPKITHLTPLLKNSNDFDQLIRDVIDHADAYYKTAGAVNK